VPEPYTIRVFVPDGDPEGVKIVELLNWTGIGIALPRAAWSGLRERAEFRRAGVYVLTGSAEGTGDDLPTIYVGQGDEIRARLESHYVNKEFWDWAYVFVSNGNALNRAHITWLEHALLARAQKAGRCHLDNANQPREPSLSESERADTNGFLREMLRILPLLGVRVFEKGTPVATPSSVSQAVVTSAGILDERDTIIVPAQGEGFRSVFLGMNCWYSIRIGGGMLPRIKYIAAYQTAPVSAITHYARVARIEPYGDDGKYRLVFAEPAKELTKPIQFGDAPQGSMQGPRYTSVAKLLAAKRVVDLLAKPSDQPIA
jgi:hypothetical protein